MDNKYEEYSSGEVSYNTNGHGAHSHYDSTGGFSCGGSFGFVVVLAILAYVVVFHIAPLF